MHLPCLFSKQTETLLKNTNFRALLLADSGIANNNVSFIFFLFHPLDETPVAYYGTNESVTMKVMGTTRTYTAKDMCAPTANTTGFFDAGYIHDVLLIDLKPSTVYYYKFGSSEVRTGHLQIIKMNYL